MSIKRIGVLTSGGDAPGMNAAIRAVVRSGIYRGFQVYGIKKGYEGLLKGDMFEMNLRSVSDIMSRGGTILQTARSKDFLTPEGVKRAARIRPAISCVTTEKIRKNNEFFKAVFMVLSTVNSCL